MGNLNNATPDYQQTNVRTSLFEKVAYANGNLACAVVYGLCYGLLTYFYTNVIGVSAALVGSVLLFSRFFDGISDVAIGIIVDKVHSKFGRGRAWILWMAIPYGVSAVLLFLIPANATAAVQGVYIFITYNLCTTVIYTALNLPYGIMAPLMTSNEQDVAKLNLFRTGAGSIGMLVVLSATLPIVNRLGGDQAAWVKVSVFYALISIIFLLWCFLGTKERVHTRAASVAENLPLLTRLKVVGSNKYFWLLLLTQIGIQFYQTIDGTCGTYYAQYILWKEKLGLVWSRHNCSCSRTSVYWITVFDLGRRLSCRPWNWCCTDGCCYTYNGC